MTIIAAYEGKESYWIASDSMSCDGYTLSEYSSKLIKKNNYYIDYSGSYRVADLIKESKELPKTIKSIKDLRKFRDILQQQMVEKTGARKEASDNETISHPIYLILITKFGIFEIHPEYQLMKTIQGFTATGSGWQVALGSLFNSRQNKQEGKKAVTIAVKASIIHTPHCGGKVYTASISKGK